MGRLALTGGKPVRTKPFPLWPVFDDRERKALLAVLDGRRWWRFGGPYGPAEKTEVFEFEDRFAAYQDARFGIAVTNGTAALEVALKTAGIGPGDEVIVPAYTFLATASAVFQVNAVAVFADVDPDTFCIDPKEVEKAITPRTRALIPVHYGGYPADMDALLNIARKHNLRVVEDAAHAHGTAWKGKKVGAIGDMGTFSFQMSKNMASGEGGIIITNDDKLAARAYSLSNFGRIEGRPKYEYHELGWNVRMPTFLAALLVVQLQRIEEQTELRVRMARLLSSRLAGTRGVQLMKDDDPRVTRRAYHIYTFKYIPEELGGIPRERFIDALRSEGIPASTGYNLPLYMNPMFLEKRFWAKNCPFSCSHYAGQIDYSRVHCPVSEKMMMKQTVMLDQNVLLGTEDDIADIAGAVRKVVENITELR